jgi:cyclase
VISIDARREGDSWKVYTHGGRSRTELNAIDWAQQATSAGAGEVLLTSIDRDGMRSGYDLELTRAVASAVDVPVIASGGAGSAGDIVAALLSGNADAALIAGIVHDGVTTVTEIKRTMQQAGVPVRMVA